MIVKKRRIGYSSFECLLRCECAVGYYQRNDQCIKGPISPKERFNLCKNRICKIGEIVFDAGCNLTGKECGKNAIFIPIIQGKQLMVSRNCVQQCTCRTIEYVDKLTHCEQKKDFEVAKQYCPQISYNHGYEIADTDCSLVNHKCGINMRFVLVESLKAANNQSRIIGCIFQCNCEKNFQYFEEDGQCMKKWYCEGGFCQLKRKIYDYGCRLTGVECGINMKFVIEQEVDGEFCIQECKCANEEEFVEKDGKCEDTKKIKQNFVQQADRSKTKILKVGQILEESGCMSTNTECGNNMIFRPIIRFYNIPILSQREKCHQRCSCKDGYDEKNGQCIEKIHQANYEEFENDIFESRQKCFKSETCELGEKISDRDCQLTGKKCGANMVFSPIGSTISGHCIQYCVCDNEFIVEDDKCLRNASNLRYENENRNTLKQRMNKNQIGILNCMRGKCKFMEEINDFGCMMKGRSCGRNMVFTIVSNITFTATNTKCIVKCACAYGYYEKNNQCVPLEETSPCKGKVCTSGERFFDADCRLSGIKCGVDKIFITVQKLHPSLSCIQECRCNSEELESGRSLHEKNALISVNFIEYCPLPYEFGEEISDRGCQLTGEKCGRNMVFVIVNFIALNNSADCIQQCSCEDGYNYLEEFGECRKKWYCEGGYCKLGREFLDYGCVFTNYSCGTNMKFIINRIDDNGTCYQRCSCINEQYNEINGQCLKSSF